jgi:hypothetical protein
MKITQDVRDYAAVMERKAAEFRESGGEIYLAEPSASPTVRR